MGAKNKSKDLKKIVIFAYDFLPWNTIAVRRVESFVKAWTQKGHAVTIITSSPYFPVSEANDTLTRVVYVPCLIRYLRRYYARFLGTEGPRSRDVSEPIQSKGEQLAKKSDAAKPRISLVKRWYAAWIGKRGLILGFRMPSLSFFWAIYCLLWLTKNRVTADVVLSTSPPPASLILGFIGKKIFFRPETVLVFDYRDAWTKGPLFSGLWPFTLAERVLESILNKKCDFLLTACESIEFAREQHGTILVPNGIDYSMLDEHPPQYRFSAEKLNLVYTGTLYELQDCLPLLKALKRLQADNVYADKVCVNFFGTVTASLLDHMKAFHLSHIITLHNLVNLKESVRLQRYADVCLFFPVTSQPKISTGKIFEYLATAGEVWSIGVSDAVGPNMRLLDKGVGIVFGSDDRRLEEVLKERIDEKLSGKISRPVAIRYFPENDRVVIAESLIERFLA